MPRLAIQMFAILFCLTCCYGGTLTAQTQLQNGEEKLASLLAGGSRTFSIQVNTTGELIVSVGETGAGLPAEPAVALFDPNGLLVAEDNGSTGGSDAYVQVTTLITGQYIAVVSDKNNDDGLAFRVRALSVPGSPVIINGRDQSLSNGQEYSSGIPLGSFAIFPIQVDVPGELIVAVGEDEATLPAEPTIQLFDPNGSLIAEDAGSTGGSEAYVQVTTSNVGQYIAVVVDKNNDDSMSFRIRALTLPGTPQIIGGRDQDLANGQEYTSAIPLGTLAVFPIQVDEPGQLIVTVGETGASQDAEPALQLFDPSGNLVGIDPGGTNSSEAAIQVTTSQIGSYTAVVNDVNTDEEMEFIVRSLRLPGSPGLIGNRDTELQNGQTASSQIPLGTFAIFPIVIEAPGTLTVLVNETGAGLSAEPTLQLFDPNGALVASDPGGTGSSDALVQWNAAQTGTYLAYVADRSYDELMEFEITADFPFLVTGQSVLVTRGIHVAGGLEALEFSDNVDYQLRRNSADIQSITEYEIQSVSPVATPVAMQITIEGAVFARSRVNRSVRLFDFDSGTWELVESGIASRFTDSTTTVTVSGAPERFVDPGTQQIKARIRYQSVNPRQQFSSSTDQFAWTIE